MADEVLFSTREAAAVWGVSIRTVMRWVKAGRAAPAKKAGGLVFTGTEVARVAKAPRPQRGGYRPGSGSKPKAPQQHELPGIAS